MKKICVVTATRAEYGLLRPLIRRISESKDADLFLLVTGMHLSPEFGYTYKEIENDGFHIDKKIEMLLSADSPAGIVKSMGVEMIGLADCFADNKVDLIVVLGDRFESLVVATVATIFQIPVAHIHGGERTEGLIDESIRHSITKMSSLHFAAIEEYRRRIIQLGEQPDRVYTVGSIGNESIHSLQLMSKAELEESISFTIDDKTILLTFHPVTLEENTAEAQFEEVLRFLSLHKEIRVIFTKANADTYGRIINKMIDEYVGQNQDRCIAFYSLGQLRYLSVLQYVSCVIGNSSSGILEVPSFKIPTINIGDRQRGRYMPASVVNCEACCEEINEAYNKVMDIQFSASLRCMENPYDKGETSKLIYDVIMNEIKRGIDIKKVFNDYV